MTDEAEWKRRFLIFNLARLCGLVVIGLGLLVAFSDVASPGGNRQFGAIIIVIGTIELAFLPHLIKQRWKN